MAKTCLKEDCKNPRFGKGYCKFHQYLRTDKTKKTQQRKAINPISESMKLKYQKYRPLRDAYMREHQYCEFEGCTSVSQDLHHKAGRVGDKMCDDSTFMAVCRKCHNYIHENPKKSRELLYLL